MTILRTTAALAAAFALTATAAAAQDLSVSDVERFIAVTQELRDFEDKYPEVAAQMQVNDPQSLAVMIDDSGNVDLYKNMASRLPAGPARKDVMSVVKKHGFSSLDAFAATGDRVIMGMMAAEMKKQDMSQMEAITPDMMAMMPPQAREQIELAKKMMAAAEKVPAADVALMEQMSPVLNDAFEQ